MTEINGTFVCFRYGWLFFTWAKLRFESFCKEHLTKFGNIQGYSMTVTFHEIMKELQAHDCMNAWLCKCIGKYFFTENVNWDYLIQLSKAMDSRYQFCASYLKCKRYHKQKFSLLWNISDISQNIFQWNNL